MYIPPVITSQLGQIAQQRMIEVENSLFQTITPTVALGEVIQLTVRQNGASGQGLVGFRGQAIKATLPPNLQPGDQILAKVSGGQDQIVLKILDLQRPAQSAPSTPSAALTRQIEDQLRSLVDTPEGFLNFKAATPLPGASSPPAGAQQMLQNQSKELAQSLKTLISTTDLKNPQTALSQLISATTGQVTESLRDAAVAIRSIVEQHEAPPGQKFVAALKTELANVLQTLRDSQAAVKGNPDPLARLNTILRAVREELKGSDTLTPHVRATLERVERSLLEQNSGKEAIDSKLENAINTLEKQLAAGPAGKSRLAEKDGTTPVDLTRLAQRLDQLASTQETLHQLNPLMQALGEPALILLPFLSHGLLNHSEVTIDPNARRRNQGGGSQDESEEGDGGDSTPFQRVQVSVPLPNLGLVDVDIAHRKDELLVRITVPDAETEQFLKNHLEHLDTTLRELGFEKAELVSAVGEHTENVPVWCEGLASRTSIRA